MLLSLAEAGLRHNRSLRLGHFYARNPSRPESFGRIEKGEAMVLVLKNEQMEGLVSMAELIEAIGQAFREMGEGKAVSSPRARLRVQAPEKEEGTQYYFNNIMGLVPGIKSMALRIDSSFSREDNVGGS